MGHVVHAGIGSLGLRLDLRLVEHHRFANGVVHLAYAVGR